MREVMFLAYATTPTGEEEVYSVCRLSRGRIEICDGLYRTHVCHPSVKTRPKILAEILLVFGAHIIRTISPQGTEHHPAPPPAAAGSPG